MTNSNIVLELGMPSLVICMHKEFKGSSKYVEAARNLVTIQVSTCAYTETLVKSTISTKQVRNFGL
jgi:hypothetical protein